MPFCWRLVVFIHILARLTHLLWRWFPDTIQKIENKSRDNLRFFSFQFIESSNCRYIFTFYFCGKFLLEVCRSQIGNLSETTTADGHSPIILQEISFLPHLMWLSGHRGLNRHRFWSILYLLHCSFTLLA